MGGFLQLYLYSMMTIGVFRGSRFLFNAFFFLLSLGSVELGGIVMDLEKETFYIGMAVLIDFDDEQSSPLASIFRRPGKTLPRKTCGRW